LTAPATPSIYTLADFDFDLPPELVAQTPPLQRGDSRLLDASHRSADQVPSLKDKRFAEIVSLFKAGDLLVMNDTKVIPARLFGQKMQTGGKVELLVERILDSQTILTQIRVSHKPKVGEAIIVHGNWLTVIEHRAPFFVLKFAGDILQLLHQFGELPLPPYISRKPDSADASRYQTVYATHEGAVAAPTAGLHFTQALLDQLKLNGVQTASVTLHVGAGTFQPVRSENLSDHRMHSEWYCISQASADAINSAKREGRRVICVGTTTLRTLESAAKAHAQSAKDLAQEQNTDQIFVQAGSDNTDIFITPGYQFRIVDELITNFHLPKSTLLMLVSAFAGFDAIRSIYQHGIEHQYRFFSYGDAMWLHCTQSSK
jgi:S-adenosylmethionine:tRNA ribosyltransferase-isomerase